jgi:hypothetical protein
MTTNHRATFRIESDPELQASLAWRGSTSPCALVDLSAGGARLEATIEPTIGDRCTLHLQLTGGQTTAQVEMEVLESTTRGEESRLLRLQNLTEPGSADHERLTKLVFELQRRQLARASGTDDASPMTSDPERREQLRPPRPARYTKRSLRPDSD